MNAVKLLLPTIAFLIGAAASCGVGLGAYREFCGGPMGVAPLLLIAILMTAGVLLSISWWREFIRNPWMVPSAVFAVCVSFYYMSFPDRIGLYQLGTGPTSPWLTLTSKVLGYLAFASFSYVPAAFVYYGTHNFLSSLGNALSRRTRNS